MKTSQQWWDEVKNNPELFNEWLVKQYRGEVTAAQRIRLFSQTFSMNVHEEFILEEIAGQEETHAQWVLELLQSRGVDPSIEGAEDRYWSETLPGIVSFELGCAVAAHAEKMRLERIQVIVDDFDTPSDVREVFSKILVDELWHEHAFRHLSDDVSMEATRGNHELGKQALGLEA